MGEIKRFCLAIVALVWLCDARADYKFISENPFEAQKRLFDDIRMGRVETAHVGPRALQAMTQESMFSATPAKLNQLGSISEICLLFGVKYTASRALAFRTTHQNGCGDWVITTQLSPEVLTSIVLVPVKLLPGRTDTCGPPGVIPPVPTGGDNFVLPNSLQCRKAEQVSAQPATDELKEACKTIEGFCKRAN
jgi:hypothetical protein